MDPKTRILSFISTNPGVTTIDIHLGIKRSSLGMHLRNLVDKGLLIKTQEEGWRVSTNYVADKTKKMSPMDLVDSCIRNMIIGK